jgi:hypothetical protein
VAISSRFPTTCQHALPISMSSNSSSTPSFPLTGNG